MEDTDNFVTLSSYPFFRCYSFTERILPANEILNRVQMLNCFTFIINANLSPESFLKQNDSAIFERCSQNIVVVYKYLKKELINEKPFPKQQILNSSKLKSLQTTILNLVK